MTTRSSVRTYTVSDLDYSEHPAHLPQIRVEPSGTAYADPAVLFTGAQWKQFSARVAAATPADPDFDLPVTVRYLGLVFTARRTTDWMHGVNLTTSCTQGSVLYVAFNFAAVRRVLRLRLRRHRHPANFS